MLTDSNALSSLGYGARNATRIFHPTDKRLAKGIGQGVMPTVEKGFIFIYLYSNQPQGLTGRHPSECGQLGDIR